jgi:hypothetical protein
MLYSFLTDRDFRKRKINLDCFAAIKGHVIRPKPYPLNLEEGVAICSRVVIAASAANHLKARSKCARTVETPCAKPV